MLPAALHDHLESLLQISLAFDRPISGGDIHQVCTLKAADGRQVLVKYNSAPTAADMFRTEALGLILLGASRVIAVPKVLSHGQASDEIAFLALDFVVVAPRSRLFWQNFGLALANLHGNTSAQFGFAHDNYIGSLPQANARHDNWPEFYATQRLLPQLRLARDAARLDASASRRLDKLCGKLKELCPNEAPALVHGDLWSGNFLCDQAGQPVLIDPAAAFAHREMDLAMAHLFGGFDPTFFTSYDSAWPLEPGFEARMEVYQLYYLLVHLNLFGAGYLTQVQGILQRFT